MTLTYFWPMSSFYTPWQHQKTKGFLVFSGGIRMEHWLKMSWRNWFCLVPKISIKYRSSRPEVFCEKTWSYKFLKFHRKAPVPESFYQKKLIQCRLKLLQYPPMRENCPNMKFFLVLFSGIWSEYGKMWTRKISVFGHFSRSKRFQ